MGFIYKFENFRFEHQESSDKEKGAEIPTLPPDKYLEHMSLHNFPPFSSSPIVFWEHSCFYITSLIGIEPLEVSKAVLFDCSFIWHW